MEENEKFGTIVADGKIINLDTISQADLEKVLNKLEAQIEEKKKMIKEQLENDE